VNGVLGRTGVLLGLLAALVGAGLAAYGLAKRRPQLVRHAGAYAYLVLGGAVLATVAMEHALVTHDFSIAFVAGNNSRETPLIYSVTGMWSALQGSILLWALILAGYLAVMVARFRRKAADSVVGWATCVGLAVAAFFFALMAGPANPFGGGPSRSIRP